MEEIPQSSDSSIFNNARNITPEENSLDEMEDRITREEELGAYCELQGLKAQFTMATELPGLEAQLDLANELQALEAQLGESNELQALESRLVEANELQALEFQLGEANELQAFEAQLGSANELQALEFQLGEANELQALEAQFGSANELQALEFKLGEANELQALEAQLGSANELQALETQLGEANELQGVKLDLESNCTMTRDVVTPSSPIKSLPTSDLSHDKDFQKSPSKNKRREDKAIDHILKALSSLQTTEEKLAALCKKYADLLGENRNAQNNVKQLQRKISLCAREKDQTQGDYNKALIAKSRLESLCRELQKQNKLIKEESRLNAKDDEERRKEIHSKFQSVMGDMLATYANIKQENTELSEQYKLLSERCILQEENIKEVYQQRELEAQLYDVKLERVEQLLKQQRDSHKTERDLLVSQAQESEKLKEFHLSQEQYYKRQLAKYTDKYEDFQTTLNKSNELFGKFKSEMDKMTKRLKKLQKESVMWREKCQESQKTMAELFDEKKKRENELDILTTKFHRLESLCRALQAERNCKDSKATLPPPKAKSKSQKPTLDDRRVKTPPNSPQSTSPETVQSLSEEDKSFGEILESGFVDRHGAQRDNIKLQDNKQHGDPKLTDTQQQLETEHSGNTEQHDIKLYNIKQHDDNMQHDTEQYLVTKHGDDDTKEHVDTNHDDTKQHVDTNHDYDTKQHVDTKRDDDTKQHLDTKRDDSKHQSNTKHDTKQQSDTKLVTKQHSDTAHHSVIPPDITGDDGEAQRGGHLDQRSSSPRPQTPDDHS